ncbi:hypothetical protein FDF98_12960 [Clostridium botulinum]|nr:hypothetical protein [Clostridium botulinum]
MDSIDFEFYIRKNDNLNEILGKWLSLLKYMNPKTFCFSHPHKGEDLQFKEAMISKFLKEDLTNYEKYLLEIKADKLEFIHIELAPYLKEVAKVSCRFNKKNYEKHRKGIFEIIDKAISCDEMMLGYGHPVIYNKYFERGYGHIQFGAYWMMWFGKWALKYIDEERFNNIKEITFNNKLTNNHLEVTLSENPWEYNNEIIKKQQRNFMKKLKLSDIIQNYNKKHEFTYIEFEEEDDSLLEEDDSPCPYED